MPAACRMNKHMASLSGDNGEAEGSCPEPAGNRAVVCQSLCNSHLKEALSSPSGLFWEQPGWAIIIMGSPGRLGIDRGAVYWGELIDSCLLIWLSLTGKPNDWKSMASEEAYTKEESGGHCTCWAWGRWSRLPSVNPMSSGRSFPTCSSDMALVYRETVLPSACVLHQHSEEGHLEVTSLSILTPPRAHLWVPWTSPVQPSQNEVGRRVLIWGSWETSMVLGYGGRFLRALLTYPWSYLRI